MKVNSNCWFHLILKDGAQRDELLVDILSELHDACGGTSGVAGASVTQRALASSGSSGALEPRRESSTGTGTGTLGLGAEGGTFSFTKHMPTPATSFLDEMPSNNAWLDEFSDAADVLPGPLEMPATNRLPVHAFFIPPFLSVHYIRSKWRGSGHRVAAPSSFGLVHLNSVLPVMFPSALH